MKSPRSLSRYAKDLSNDKKIEHIDNLLEKAKIKNEEELDVKYIHSLRIDCIFLAYFGHETPSYLYERKMEIFPEIIDEKIVTNEKRTYFDGYRRAREILLADCTNTVLYDITDKEFHQYRYDAWKKKENQKGWNYVEKKRFRRR